MRLHRIRCRRRIRCIEIQVHATYIDVLVRKGLLDPARRQDRDAIREAIQDLLFCFSTEK